MTLRNAWTTRFDCCAAAKIARPLYDAPNFALVLPQSRTRKGAAQTTKDLSEHPWAGVNVVLTLLARDEAKNEAMRNACMMTDATFADPRKLDSDESNLERTERKIEHASIAADPSDKGMQAIGWPMECNRTNEPGQD